MARTPRRQTPVRRKIPDKHGRVTHIRYCRAVTEEICRRLAEGQLWHHMANTPDMPAYDTFYRWQRKHPEFAEAVRLSKEIAGHYKADRALEVAEATTAATVSADRLRVSTLLWHAAKAAPEIYGSGKAAKRDQPVEYVVRIRQFENYVGEDGRTYVREILPEPKRGRGR